MSPLFSVLCIMQNACGGFSPLDGTTTHRSVTTSSLQGISLGARLKVRKVLAEELFTFANRSPGVLSTISASGIMRSAPSYMTPISTSGGLSFPRR
uniref:Putative secreted protein n=1 Tax=Anopheles triannulatus TaxID=58253 RepID=A0A2M4B6M3_9DIPT